MSENFRAVLFPSYTVYKCCDVIDSFSPHDGFELMNVKYYNVEDADHHLSIDKLIDYCRKATCYHSSIGFLNFSSLWSEVRTLQ